jgi:hypothetical protein
VNQGILLLKLNCYEIQGKAEKWFESYLNDQKQRAEIRYQIQSVTPTKKFRHYELQSSSGLNISSAPFSDMHW